jgi:hypothetical protein
MFAAVNEQQPVLLVDSDGRVLPTPAGYDHFGPAA